MKIFNVFKKNKKTENEFKPIVREMTLIGETNIINNVYVVQQSTKEGIKNYCVSASEEEYMRLLEELKRLNSSDVYLYLKSRFLIEPFLENNFEKVIERCKVNLPKVRLKEYSIFIL